MEKTCTNCSSNFEITENDKAFYTKITVPEPTFCPDCRRQRRLSFRNERCLYKRTCNLCSRPMVSIFDEHVPFPVYCNDCWWSDKWDPFQYGRDFDFSKPFFEQLQDLMIVVPKAGLLQLNNENSEYNTLLAFSKNTYMSPGSYYAEDCYYATKSQYCKDCLDSSQIDHSELVRYGLNCNKCYSSHHLVNCKNCSDSAYMANAIGCQHCFMCSGIANKKYHYKNESYSEQEYTSILKRELQKDPEILMREFEEFNATVPKKYQNQIHCENSSGDYIQNCNNAIECYDCFEIEDSKYIVESVNVKDSMDLTMHDKDIELCYELSSGGERNTNLKFSFCTIASPDSEYMYNCFYVPQSFGCDSINRHSKNCIFNKKYSPEEYDSLRKRIIKHMRSTGEYGEFFPMSLSLHSYNETSAQVYYPLTEEEANGKGIRWRKKDPKQYIPATVDIPKSIQDVPDSFSQEILACKECGKNYKVIAPELQLLKKMNEPISSFCPDCRHIQLLSLKNPRKLWKRNCDSCSVEIESTYAPDMPEKVLCENCYLKTVY